MIKLYPNSFETALKNGNYDIGLYMASCKENVRCARDIEKAINKNFDGYKLGKGFEKEIIETYGFQRVNFVLAYNIQQKVNDGRINTENKDWAKNIDIEDDKFNSYDRRSEYLIDADVGLLNIFANRVIEEINTLKNTENEEISDIDMTVILI